MANYLHNNNNNNIIESTNRVVSPFWPKVSKQIKFLST